MDRYLLSLGTLLVAGALAGCADRKSSGGTVVVPASTAGAATGGTGATSAASTNQPGTAAPASSVAGPGLKLRITDPAPGTFAVQPQLTVRGDITAAPGASLQRAEASLNGRPLPATLALGAFQFPVTLQPGLNIITVRATATSGRVSLAHAAVLHGTFLSATQGVADGVQLRLNNNAAGLRGIERVIQAQLTPAALSARLQQLGSALAIPNPLGGGTIQIQLQGISLPVPPTVQVQTFPGGIQVYATVTNASVNVSVPTFGVQGPVTFGGTFNIAYRPAIQPGVGGAPNQIVVPPPARSITGLVIDLSQLGGVFAIANGIATAQIQQVIEKQIDDSGKLIQDALNLYLGPQTIAHQGIGVTISHEPTALVIDATGLAASVRSQARAPTPVTGVLAPGSLSTAGAAAILPPGPEGFYVAIDDDAANRALFAIWQAGGLFWKIDQTVLQQAAQSAPIPLRLEAALLMSALPELTGKFAPTDPVEIEVAAKLPPVVAMRAGAFPARLDAGGFEVEIYVVTATGRKLAVKFCVQARLAASASILNNQLTVTVDPASEIQVGVLDEPIADVDDEAAERFVQTTFRTLVPVALQAIPNLSTLFQGLPGLGVARAGMTSGGPSGDHLIFSGSLQ